MSTRLLGKHETTSHGITITIKNVNLVKEGLKQCNICQALRHND